MGNYLATMHRQGVAVWGGPSFQRLARYSHQNVQLIEFSPAEKYLMTYSSIEPTNPREKVQVSSLRRAVRMVGDAAAAGARPTVGS
jgi:translation initiation factor 3 subunit B